MRKSHLRRYFLLFVLAVVLVLFAAVFLNHRYAYIYKEIGAANLQATNSAARYLIGTATASTTLSYLALGDSLTAGVGTNSYQEAYPYLIAQKLAGVKFRVDLSDISYPGYTTADLLNRLDNSALKQNYDVITVLIGVNDIHGQLSEARFRKNYEAILKRLSGRGAKIYLISIPYIGAQTLIEPPFNAYFNSRTQEFNEIIKKLAIRYQVQYLDLYTPTLALFRKPGSHYAPDLFHPSASGYKIWADIIYDNLHY